MDALKKVFFAVCLVLLSTSAFAVGWGQKTRIRSYFVWDTGNAMINTDNNENPDNCQFSTHLVLDTTTPNFKAIWSQVIAAHSLGQTVTLYYDGCYQGAYPKIRVIAVPESW